MPDLPVATTPRPCPPRKREICEIDALIDADGDEVAAGSPPVPSNVAKKLGALHLAPCNGDNRPGWAVEVEEQRPHYAQTMPFSTPRKSGPRVTAMAEKSTWNGPRLGPMAFRSTSDSTAMNDRGRQKGACAKLASHGVRKSVASAMPTARTRRQPASRANVES